MSDVLDVQMYVFRVWRVSSIILCRQLSTFWERKASEDCQKVNL